MRKILIALGALVVLVVAVALIVPFLIPADAYVARVAAAVKQATGRDLKIAGKVSFHLLPSIALRADDVTLSNAPGSSAADFATIKTLDVGVKLMPLLSHKLEIDHLTLDQPVINLEVNKAGQNNWSFQPETSVKAPADKPESKADVTKQLQSLSLGAVKISGGTVSYFDAAKNKREQLTKLDANFSLPSIAEKMTLSANGDWNGKTIAVDLTIKNPRDLLQGKGSALSAKIKSDLMTLALDAEAKSATGFSGTIDLSSPSLRQLAAWAGSPVAPGPGLGALDLKSAVTLEGKTLALSNFALALDALKITGAVAVDAGGAKPQIKGSLDLGAVDLNPYLAPANAGNGNVSTAPPAAPTTAGTGWSEAPIDASALKLVDANLALSLTSLKFHTIEIGKSEVVLALAGARANIAFKQLSLYGGNGTGTLALDGANPGIGFQSNLALGNVAVQPLLMAAMGVDRFTGTGNLNLALTGAGRSQAQLMATLGGKAGMKIANGTIKGIDLVAIEHKPLKGLAESSSTAETPFTALTGSFAITSGVASNQDLVLASPALGLTGKGTIDLYHRTIDYRVEPSLPGGIQGGKSGIYGASVPITISGPWSAVSYAPDVSAVVGQKANQMLNKELGKLGGGNSKTGGMLKGLFGH